MLSKDKDTRGKYKYTPQETAKKKETESGEAKKRQAKGDKEAKSQGACEKSQIMYVLVKGMENKGHKRVESSCRRHPPKKEF